MSKLCTIVDQETGEIISTNFKLDDEKDVDRKKLAIRIQKEVNMFHKAQQEICGNFVFFIYKNIKELSDVLTDSELVKYVFLGTYVKADGSLRMDNHVTFMDKEKMAFALNLTKRNFEKFYKKLIDLKLLIEKEDHIYISTSFFYRGKEKEYKNVNSELLENYTRIYIDATRKIYYDSKHTQHSKIAMAYKLLPHISWKYNVLCHNPEETDLKQVVPFYVSDIMEILGYYKSNSKRFKSDLFDLKYGGYGMFAVWLQQPYFEKGLIAVNPLILYRGNDLETIDNLANLFKVPKNKVKTKN